MDSPNFVSNQPIPVKRKKGGIIGLNLVIFLAYYFGALMLSKTTFNYLVPFNSILWFGYIVHVIILVVLGVIDIPRGKSNGEYFLTALAISVIGFGACTVAVLNGLSGL